MSLGKGTLYTVEIRIKVFLNYDNRKITPAKN